MTGFLFGVALPLALTIAVECGICHAVARDKSLTFHVLLCNLLTNPAMNISLAFLGLFCNYLGLDFSATYTVALIICEIAVFFVEGCTLAYIGHKRSKAFGFSALLNASSVLVGLLIF